MTKRSKSINRYFYRLLFCPAIMTFIMLFFINDLPAVEKCRKLSVAYMSESSESFKGDQTFIKLSGSVVSSLGRVKNKIGRSVSLADLETSGKRRCDDLRCAVELCRAGGMNHLVSVRVIRKTAAKVEDLNKYLMKRDSGTVYSVYVRVTAIPSGKSELLFSAENITSGSAGSFSKRIEKSIIRYFNAIETCSNDEEDAGQPFIMPGGISVSGIVIRPFGAYADTADTGYGINVRFSSYFPGVEGFDLAIDLSTAYLSPAGGNINSAYFLSPRLLAGYSFSIIESFRIMPFAGTGYVFHIIDGDSENSGENSGENSMELYYNPSVSCGIDFIYNILPGSSLFISPSFTYFFGQDGSGSYAIIGAGYRYEF